MKIVLLFTLSFILNAKASFIPGDNLLNYFSSTCTTLGSYTNAALGDAKALIETLHSIKDDKDCKSVSGAISQLDNLQSKLFLLDNEYFEQVEIAKLEAQEIELFSQISKSSDPIELSLLRQSLSQVQVDKVSYLADEKTRRDYDGGKLRNIYTQLIKSSSTAYETITNNHLCLNKNPGILNTATSLTGSVLASTALINPALGLGMAALTDLLGNTLEFYRNKEVNEQIKSIANRSTIPVGLTCALETLTNRQCEISDAKSFLKIEADLNVKRISKNEGVIYKMQEISQIIDVDIPVILDWFEKVKAGAPSSNSADSSRREDMFSKDKSIKVAKSKGEGLFSENEAIFNNTTDIKLRYQIIKKIILELTADSSRSRFSSSSDDSNPLFEIYSNTYAPYYLLGLNSPATYDRGDPIHFDAFDPFTQWPGTNSYVPSLTMLQTRYLEWISLAEDKVNQELFTILQPDPLKILSDFNDQTSNTYKRSPEKSLDHILLFLKKNKLEKNSSHITEMFNSTLSALNNIQQALSIENKVTSSEECEPTNVLREDAMAIISKPERPSCDRYLNIIKIIYKEAQLDLGSQVIKNRLEATIKIAVNELILNSDLSDDDSNLAQLLAADTYLDQLKLISGKSNPALIMADLDMADVTTQNNLNNFGLIFGEMIRAQMKRSQPQFLSKDPDISGPHKKTRAKLCLLLSSIPNWPITDEGGILQYCKGLSLQDLKDGPKTPIITRELVDSPLKNRRCIYRDYQRKNKIYKEWGISL